MSAGIPHICAIWKHVCSSNDRLFHLFNLYSSILDAPFGQLCRVRHTKGAAEEGSRIVK